MATAIIDVKGTGGCSKVTFFNRVAAGSNNRITSKRIVVCERLQA